MLWVCACRSLSWLRPVELDDVAVAARVAVEAARADRKILPRGPRTRRRDKEFEARDTVGGDRQYDRLPGPLARAAFGPHCCARQPADGHRDAAWTRFHVAQLQRVIVADMAVGQLNIERAAFMLHGEVEPRTLSQRKEHGSTDRDPDAEVDQRARTHQRLADRLRRAACLFGRSIVERAIIDQPARSPDLLHHPVARVDTERAGDAADLRAFANVDPRRADRDALIAVDAVTEGARMRLCLLDAAARP